MDKDNIAIRFNEFDSRAKSNNNLYSGWTIGYDLAYNGRRYRIRKGEGLLECRPECRDMGEFDESVVSDGVTVDVTTLHLHVQVEIRAVKHVPAGYVLFVDFHDPDDRRAFEAGEEIPGDALQCWHLMLAAGESEFVSKDDEQKNLRETVRYTNDCGRAVIEVENEEDLDEISTIRNLPPPIDIFAE